MLRTVVTEETEPPETLREELDGVLGVLQSEIRLAGEQVFDLVRRHQYEYFTMGGEVLYIEKKGEYRNGWDMLYGSPSPPIQVGLVFPKTKTAKIFQAGGVLSENQHKIIKTILEHAGYCVTKM